MLLLLLLEVLTVADVNKVRPLFKLSLDMDDVNLDALDTPLAGEADTATAAVIDVVWIVDGLFGLLAAQLLG